MKNLKTYIPSLIFSLLIVFSLIGTCAAATAKIYANSDKLIELADDEEIIPMICEQLEKHFNEKYNETGIPTEVYTEALTDEYIRSAVMAYINDGFCTFAKGWAGAPDFEAPKNEALEQNIMNFFSDYADSIDYPKDEKYEEKVQSAIDSAYKAIDAHCDIYKLRTLNQEGILGKLGKIYNQLDKILFAAVGASLLLAVILILINIKGISASLYWLGISGLIAGIIGLIPCVYLTATKYFDSFTVKQPQIFAAFTGLMYKAVNSFAVCMALLAVFGILMIVIYSVIVKKKKTEK